MRAETIIIGGGMAGLSCAHEFMEVGHDFVMISEGLGGRVCPDPETGVNFGALFAMSNYHYAKKIVGTTSFISQLDASFHNADGKQFGTLSKKTLGAAPGAARFYVAMIDFERHYQKYKDSCLTMSQAEAFKAHPSIGRLFAMSAADYIRQARLDSTFVADFACKFAYACTGVDYTQISALDFLNVSQGLLLPLREITFDAEAWKAKLGSRFVDDTTLGIEQVADGFEVRCASGTHQCRTLVVATPATVTKHLLALDVDIRTASTLYVYNVLATLKPNLRAHRLNLFSFESPFIFTIRNLDGSYSIFSREEVDLAELCTRHMLIRQQVWAQALYVSGPALLDQHPSDGIWIAGDHNGLGLEPTAISGVYAARQVLQHA